MLGQGHPKAPRVGINIQTLPDRPLYTAVSLKKRAKTSQNGNRKHPSSGALSWKKSNSCREKVLLPKRQNELHLRVVGKFWNWAVETKARRSRVPELNREMGRRKLHEAVGQC